MAAHRAVLNREKKGSCTQLSQKSPRAHHVLAVGGGQLAVGDWQLDPYTPEPAEQEGSGSRSGGSCGLGKWLGGHRRSGKSLRGHK